MMAPRPKQPPEDLQASVRRIDRGDKENAERREAARRYAGEDEKHFCDLLKDSVDTAVESRRRIRRIQAECWDLYHEKEPEAMASKDPWQSRLVVPRPNQSVLFAAANVKKAFQPKFLTVEDKQNPHTATFWQELLDIQLDPQHADFPIVFVDALIMALSVGESMEMIPRWNPGSGLEFSLVEPWKIHRDPDAPSRNPQGGLYWVHQEWLDWFVLKELEKAGKYENVDSARSESTDSDDPMLTKEMVAERKRQQWNRSQFRSMLLTSEYWGTILSPKGEMLMENATFTVAGNRVISPPSESPYSRLKWPGISFSPLPDILGHGGRGLLEGIRTVWDAMNTVMQLHLDNLMWIVNPPREISVDLLADPEDVDCWPGKAYLSRGALHGQQAVRAIDQRDVTDGVLSNMQFLDQLFQRATHVTDAVQGLPGYRQDMTYRESQMLLDQAMGVYALMGANVEGGAVWAVSAAQDCIQSFAQFSDYAAIYGEEFLTQLGIVPDPSSPSGVAGLPELSGTFHISGMDALMKEQEGLKAIQEIILPLLQDPNFQPFMKPYEILKAIEHRTKLTDEGLIATDKEAQAIQQQMAMAPPPPESGGPPPESEI